MDWDSLINHLEEAGERAVLMHDTVMQDIANIPETPEISENGKAERRLLIARARQAAQRATRQPVTQREDDTTAPSVASGPLEPSNPALRGIRTNTRIIPALPDITRARPRPANSPSKNLSPALTLSNLTIPPLETTSPTKSSRGTTSPKKASHVSPSRLTSHRPPSSLATPTRSIVSSPITSRKSAQRGRGQGSKKKVVEEEQEKKLPLPCYALSENGMNWVSVDNLSAPARDFIVNFNDHVTVQYKKEYDRMRERKHDQHCFHCAGVRKQGPRCEHHKIGSNNKRACNDCKNSSVPCGTKAMLEGEDVLLFVPLKEADRGNSGWAELGYWRKA